MTIKNIYLKIHPFFYIFMLTALITGNIRDFLIFTSIIIIHELGHIISGILLNWCVSSVTILPFGGLTIFNINLNTPILEQIIVSITGPLFQITFFIILNKITPLSNQIIFYNYALLIFNLLPIFPLDGSKILNSLLNLIFPFKISHIISIIISIIFLTITAIYVDSLIIFIICLFLCINILKEIKNHKYIFNRFLFERYTQNLKFKKNKTITSINNMKLEYKHLFLIENKYYTERNILSKRFDNTNKLW